jgi:hypothetical protein
MILKSAKRNALLFTPGILSFAALFELSHPGLPIDLMNHIVSYAFRKTGILNAKDLAKQMARLTAYQLKLLGSGLKPVQH